MADNDRYELYHLVNELTDEMLQAALDGKFWLVANRARQISQRATQLANGRPVEAAR